jgi:hypothetical protein
MWNEVYRDYISVEQEVHLQANNETVNANVFKFTGSIEVVAQYAEVTEVTNATNITNVYADIWDGTNSKNLTAAGANFSGLTVGSFFSKLEAVTEEYVVHIASQNRVTEITADNIGQPFLITAKQGVNNYIRFNFTTNTTLDFKMKVFFKYRIINGGSLEFV